MYRAPVRRTDRRASVEYSDLARHFVFSIHSITEFMRGRKRKKPIGSIGKIKLQTLPLSLAYALVLSIHHLTRVFKAAMVNTSLFSQEVRLAGEDT